MSSLRISAAGLRVFEPYAHGEAAGGIGLKVPPRRLRTGVPPHEEEGEDPDPAFVISAPGILPHEVYACETFIHLAAVRELLLVVGYQYVGGDSDLNGYVREPAIDDERATQIRAATAEWARRWVTGPVSDMVAAVQRFLADEHGQYWMHRVNLSRLEPCHWSGYGANTLNMLMYAEPSFRAWLEPLYARFLEGGGPASASPGTRPAPPACGLFFNFEGFFWCPRMATDPRRIDMQEASDGARWPDDLDPYALEVLAAVFRNREPNCTDRERHSYGCLQPARAHPATHLEVIVNLSAHEQRADYGDAQPVYSRDSHKLSPEARLQRLRQFVEEPPDPAMVHQACFRGPRPVLKQHVAKLRNSTRAEVEQLAARLRESSRPREGDIIRPSDVACKVSAAKVAITAHPYPTVPDHLDLGTRLNFHMGVARAICGIVPYPIFNPVTSPLWVGPPVRVPMPPGAALALPSNLVHQIARYQTSGSTFSLYKKVCLAGSFARDRRLLTQQRRMWKYCWGLADSPWSELWYRIDKRPDGKKPSRPYLHGPGLPAPTSPRRANHRLDADCFKERFRRAAADHDVKQRCLYDGWLARTARNRILGVRGLSWLFAFAPEVRPFFSLPHQLARALVLRFPQHYPPATTDVCALADRLIAEREAFAAPPEVAAMIAKLWEAFAE
jgi:hypothetical protein